MKEAFAKKVIQRLQKNYDEIADQFDKTRSKPWPEFTWIKKFINKGEKVLELGCGNGRLYKTLKSQDIDYTGIDFSENLIKKAKKENPKASFEIADITKHEIETRAYDKIISIASFHHIPSRKLRERVLKKIFKGLRDDGLLIISVWNLWQTKYTKHLITAFFRSFFTGYETTDLMIPWKKPDVSKKWMRYYHAFTRMGLKALLAKNGFEIVDEYKDSSRNFTMVCRKKMVKAVGHPIFTDKNREKIGQAAQPATCKKY
jgi:alkylated DNA repair protein alkB family protein 8